MPTKRVFWIVLSVIVVGLLGICLAYRFNFIDFQVYYYAGRSLLAGRTDLYAPDFTSSAVLDYRYPPLFIVLFAPLSRLPYEFAEYVWYWFCALEIGGCAVVVKRIIEQVLPEAKAAKFRWKLWGLTLLATGQYFIIALKYGNAHLLMTLLLFGSFYLLMRRKDGSAALLMSLAVTIKIIPLIALPYFAIKRRWNFLALTALFVIALNLAPAFYFGFSRNVELLGGWYEHVVVNQESHEKDSWVNLSLKGQLRRYLTEIDYSKRAAGSDNHDTEYRQVNVASLPENVSNRIWIIVSFSVFAALLLLVYFSDRRLAENNLLPPEDTNSRQTLIEYSLIICLILLIGPLTPKVYFIKMLLPFACLSAIAFAPGHSKNKISRAILILIAGANLALPLLPGREIQRLLLVIGTDFYLLCLLMFVGFSLLISSIFAKESTTQLTEKAAQ